MERSKFGEMKHKEYYTESGNRIRLFNGDCMEFMQGLEENAYDLSIVDPPYGIGIDGQKEDINNGQQIRKEHKFKGWDNDVPEAPYFQKLYKITNNQILWGANYYPQYLNASKGWIIWYKGQKGLTMSDAEMAYSTFKKPTRVVDIHRTQLWQESPIHPTQKPVKLYRWLLQNYAEEGDTIFDSHGGSMSLAIACYIEDFELDIIDLDEDYYRDAVQRFEQHISQTTLF